MKLEVFIASGINIMAFKIVMVCVSSFGICHNSEH